MSTSTPASPELWYVAATDNYDRDTVNDELVQDNLTEAEARKAAKDANESAHPWGTYYYVARPKSKPLHVWHP